MTSDAHVTDLAIGTHQDFTKPACTGPRPTHLQCISAASPDPTRLSRTVAVVSIRNSDTAQSSPLWFTRYQLVSLARRARLTRNTTSENELPTMPAVQRRGVCSRSRGPRDPWSTLDSRIRIARHGSRKLIGTDELGLCWRLKMLSPLWGAWVFAVSLFQGYIQDSDSCWVPPLLPLLDPSGGRRRGRCRFDWHQILSAFCKAVCCRSHGKQRANTCVTFGSLSPLYEDTCNSNVRLHVVSPLVCVLSALKLVPVNIVMNATMPTQRWYNMFTRTLELQVSSWNALIPVFHAPNVFTVETRDIKTSLRGNVGNLEQNVKTRIGVKHTTDWSLLNCSRQNLPRAIAGRREKATHPPRRWRSRWWTWCTTERCPAPPWNLWRCSAAFPPRETAWHSPRIPPSFYPLWKVPSALFSEYCGWLFSPYTTCLSPSVRLYFHASSCSHMISSGSSAWRRRRNRLSPVWLWFVNCEAAAVHRHEAWAQVEGFPLRKPIRALFLRQWTSLWQTQQFVSPNVFEFLCCALFIFCCLHQVKWSTSMCRNSGMRTHMKTKCVTHRACCVVINFCAERLRLELLTCKADSPTAPGSVAHIQTLPHDFPASLHTSHPLGNKMREDLRWPEREKLESHFHTVFRALRFLSAQHSGGTRIGVLGLTSEPVAILRQYSFHCCAHIALGYHTTST